MSTPAERAADRLNALQGRKPDTVRLARVCSLAIRVDTPLLRRLRLELLPDVDVGSEADLWFSPLVESRGTAGFVLEQHVAMLLRDHLATDRPVFERVNAITAHAHAALSPLLALEQSVTALALLQGNEALPQVDEAFEGVLRALVRDDEPAMDVARWMVRAAPRFPPLVWRAANAYSSIVASSLRLGGGRIVQELLRLDYGDIESLAWALPASVRLERVAVGVELTGATLQFKAVSEASATIGVPPTTPPVVEVRWTAGNRPVRVLIDAVPGRVVDLQAEVPSLTIRTVAGETYAVSMETPAPSEAAHDVYISYARRDRERAKRIAEILAKQGWKTWVDVGSLRAGEELPEAISRAIRDARVVLVLWSRAALSSEFVLDEARQAMERGTLVPVRLDTVEPPIRADRSLVDLSFIDMTRWKGDEGDPDLQRLLGVIRRRLSPAQAAPTWKPEKARILPATPLEEACVRIVNEDGRIATGFYVGPRQVVTAAQPFLLDSPNAPTRLASARALTIQSRGLALEADVIAQEAGVLLLQQPRDAAFTGALPLTTTVTSRPSPNQLLVPSAATVIVAFGDRTISLEARPHVLRDLSDRFDVDVPERHLPDEFFGAPVIIGNGVAGIVIGMQSGSFPQSSLQVTGAIVLQKLLRRGGPVAS